MYNRDAEKVKWLRTETLPGGIEVAVSDKSGIVRVKLPSMGGFRSVTMYADEFEAFRIALPLIQSYCKKNEDVAQSQDVARERSKQIRGQQRAEAKATEALQNLPAETLEKALQHILANKKQA